MPEDDPLFIACLVEFLYTGFYQKPLFGDEQFSPVRGSPQKERQDLYLCKVFMKALYHARVFAVAEKYGCQDLCCQASWEIKDCRANGTDADELEFLVQLHEMPRPGSALRLDLGWKYSD